jgi:hypothetical protein
LCALIVFSLGTCPECATARHGRTPSRERCARPVGVTIGDGDGHIAIGCQDIRATCDRIRVAGGKIVREPKDEIEAKE